MTTPLRRSPLALAVLSLLAFEPLHPYGMQQLIKLWGKDQVVNVGQRANLYKAINRLRDAGLVTVRQTERDQQFPERTVYELTEAGRETARGWLTEMLTTPRNEFPEFPAALSFGMLLSNEELRAALTAREQALTEDLATADAELADGIQLPRVTMLDDEYRRAVLAAELTWVRGVLADLRSGALTWSAAGLRAVGDQTGMAEALATAGRED